MSLTKQTFPHEKMISKKKSKRGVTGLQVASDDVIGIDSQSALVTGDQPSTEERKKPAPGEGTARQNSKRTRAKRLLEKAKKGTA